VLAGACCCCRGAGLKNLCRPPAARASS
jgi:hypothetical protein